MKHMKAMQTSTSESVPARHHTVVKKIMKALVKKNLGFEIFILLIYFLAFFLNLNFMY